MNILKKKLKSSLGASSIIALLFFVVAMMVGAVVLSAAGTNAGRASHALKDQQEYYAVESAAGLFKSNLIGEDSKIVITRTYTYDSGKPAGTEVTVDYQNSGMLKNIISIDEAGSIEAIPDKGFSVTLDGDSKITSAVPKVEGTMNLDVLGNNEDDLNPAEGQHIIPDYDLILSLKLGASSATGELGNSIYLTYAGKARTITVYDTTKEPAVRSSDITTITWHEQSVDKA